MKMIIRYFILLFILLSGNTAFADKSITFSWDANTESDLAGYRLYEVTAAGSHSLVADVGNVIAHTVIVPDVTDKAWVLTAYDTTNNESGYSNAVNIDTKAPGSPTLRITIIIDVVTP